MPVDALYDRDAAHEATLRNLLQRKGYASLDAVRAEGEQQGKIEGKIEGEMEGELRGRRDALYVVLATRGLSLSEAQRRTIEAARDKAQLDVWIASAAVATSPDEVLQGPEKKARTRRPRKA